MDVTVACVVPDALGFELKGVEMRGGLVMCLGVCLTVPTATDVSTDEAYPKVCG